MTRIEDYALVGDLQTAALVSRDGSVDWLCFPRFDSGACFASLLGGPEHGCWSLRPVSPGTSTRRYLHDTLVLETTWTTEDGSVARVIDFMPPRGKAPDIVRIVEGVKGCVEFRSELTIRFDYGRIVPWVRKRTHEERHPRRDRRAGRALLPHARRDARRGPAHGLGAPGRRGAARPVRPHLVPVARGGSGGDRRGAGARRDRGVLAGVERGVPARAARRLGPARAPVAHRAQGADVRPDRRDRRRADDVAARVDRLGAQLGLPLLLAARRDAHAARAAPLQPRRRGGTVAPLADPGDRGRSRGRPDHVRRRRRAAPQRVRAAVARRLRGLAAGAGRQRGERPAPARRLRRGARLLLPGPSARPAGRPAGVGDPARVARPSGRGVARAGRRDLGDPRRAPPLRPFQGDGLGCVRPRGADGRGAPLRGAGRPLAPAPRRDPPGRLRPRLRPRARLLHAVLRLEGARRESPAAAAHRLPAGDRPADPRHDQRNRAGAAPGRVRAPLSHPRGRPRRAAAGRGRVPAVLVLALRLLRAARPPRRGARAVPAARRPRQRPRPLFRRSTTRRPTACSGTSPRRSRTSRSSTRRSTSRRTCLRRCTAGTRAGSSVLDGAGRVDEGQVAQALREVPQQLAALRVDLL